MDRWQERPPAQVACHRTGKDDAKQGPYFVEAFAYSQVVSGPEGQRWSQVKPLVHAASFIRSVCDAPGSPFVLFTIDEAAQREAELDELRERVAELELQLEEARSGPIDHDVFISNVVSILDSRYAKKTGPKPAAA